MTMNAGYQLRNLRKGYGREFSLELEQLNLPAQQVTCLLGPTGSGKSTLLRLLAALDEPDAGEVFYDGAPFLASRLSLETQRRVTLVHQRPLLLTATVMANVCYGLRLRGLQPPYPQAAALLERLGLASQARQMAGTLSGGQTQLVALARALVIKPDVLLLDEPTANLDPAHVQLVEEVLGEFQQSQRRTIVWATHNMFQARRVADHVALLLGGRLVEFTDRETFFESPADRRTADFVQGRMVY